MLIQLFHDRDQPRVRVDMRILVIQPVDVREQNQQVCVHAGCHRCGQRIVVPDAQLLRGNGVVLVDDGQNAECQQTFQRVVEILLAHRVVDVRCGNQQLCHRMVVLGEQPVVNVHQLALPDGSSRLLGRSVRGARAEVQLADAHGDGAGGHQNDFVPGVLQVADDAAQVCHAADVGPSGGMGQGRCSDLDNDFHVFFRFLLSDSSA